MTHLLWVTELKLRLDISTVPLPGMAEQWLQQTTVLNIFQVFFFFMTHFKPFFYDPFTASDWTATGTWLDIYTVYVPLPGMAEQWLQQTTVSNIFHCFSENVRLDMNMKHQALFSTKDNNNKKNK